MQFSTSATADATFSGAASAPCDGIVAGIGGGGPGVGAYYRAWLQAAGVEDAVVVHHNTPLGLLSSVRAGVGLAALPSFVADRDPDLIRCLPPMEGDTMGLYLITHERLRHTPRVRAVMDFLADRLT